MQNTLIDSSVSSLTMTSILRRCISAAGLKEIKIATGYWDIPGIALVVSELRAFLEQDDAKLKLVIGPSPCYLIADKNRCKHIDLGIFKFSERTGNCLCSFPSDILHITARPPRLDYRQ